MPTGLIHTASDSNCGSSSKRPTRRFRCCTALAGGLSWVKAEAELSGSGSVDDTSLGFYTHGGAYWTIGRHLNIGADLKAVVGTDLDFGDADYVQFGVLLGYSF